MRIWWLATVILLLIFLIGGFWAYQNAERWLGGATITPTRRSEIPSPTQTAKSLPSVTLAAEQSVTASPTADQTATEQLFPFATLPPQATPIPYRVKPGDTLSEIAEEICGNPALVFQIAAQNGVEDPDLIQPDRWLLIICDESH